MLLKHVSLETEETEKKLKSVNVLTVEHRKEVLTRLWALIFLSYCRNPLKLFHL